MSTETLNKTLYGDSGSLSEWRKRFVSDSELNQMVGEFTRQRSEAQNKLAEIDTKLAQLGDRLECLGKSLQRPDPSITSEELSKLLRFGPESGVTVDGIVDFLNERNRLGITIADCELRLRNMGVRLS
jgi:hypothetical protein